MAIIRPNSHRPLRREATRRRGRRAIPSPGMSNAVPSEASASSAMANRAKSLDQAWMSRTRARLKPSHHFASLKPASHDQRKPYSAAAWRALSGRLLTRYQTPQVPPRWRATHRHPQPAGRALAVLQAAEVALPRAGDEAQAVRA